MVADLRLAARQALACLDLTSLNDGDTPQTIDDLVRRSQGAHGSPAALCVWPRFVAQTRALAPASLRVAAVVNFPSGQEPLEAVVAQTQAVLADGAQEVDLVLPWKALMQGDEASACAMVRAVRRAAGANTLKLIIESGSLASPELIRQACLIGLNEGVDFLKTSTGKTAVGATLEAAQVMLHTMSEHPRGASVGFKASGGIRTVADAAAYLELVAQHLGPQALSPSRLRFGASGLLNDIEAVLSGAPASAGPASSY